MTLSIGRRKALKGMAALGAAGMTAGMTQGIGVAFAQSQ